VNLPRKNPVYDCVNKEQRMSITRRSFVSRSLATASTLTIARRAFGLAPGETCVLTAEQEVGPFYVTGEFVRQNIAEEKPGIPLRLRLVFVDKATCQPLRNAAVDLWHCDALGIYSGYTKTSLGPPPGGGPGGPGGPPPDFDPSHGPPNVPPPGGPGGSGGRGGGMKPTDQLTFLRGIQMTDANGSVEFRTIFPGFYQGRVNHIHMKVRLGGHKDGKSYAAGHTAHTGQVFFPEDLNLKLMAHQPYASHTIHRTTVAEDMVFNGQDGSSCVATVVPLKADDPSAGYLAELRLGVDSSASPAPVRPGLPDGPTTRGAITS
jgi:protocatechuate 3,4-dioxygenase beta subunit